MSVRPGRREPPKKRVAPADAAAAAAGCRGLVIPVESKSLQPLRQMVRRAVEHGSVGRPFLCIFLSSSLALMTHGRIVPPVQSGAFPLDLVFTSLFTVEALGKIYAYASSGLATRTSAPRGMLSTWAWLLSGGCLSPSPSPKSPLAVSIPCGRSERYAPSASFAVCALETRRDHSDGHPRVCHGGVSALFFLIVCDPRDTVTGGLWAVGPVSHPGGCRGDGHLWYNPDIGHFVTSLRGPSFFRDDDYRDWPDVLHLMQDAHLPTARQCLALALARSFCIVWIFVGALFIQNLFVGVVIDRFGRSLRGGRAPTSRRIGWRRETGRSGPGHAPPRRPNKDASAAHEIPAGIGVLTASAR